MINKIVTLLLLLTLTGGALSSAIVAQTKQEKKAAEVKTKVQKLGTGEKTIVKVKLNNGTEYVGYMSQANDADFFVVDSSGTSHTVNYAEVKSIGGKNMSTGAKIAIGAGIAGGITAVVLLLVFHHITRNN